MMKKRILAALLAMVMVLGMVGCSNTTTGTETPSTGTETPSTGTETPSTGTETPSTGTETPSTGTETPVATPVPEVDFSGRELQVAWTAGYKDYFETYTTNDVYAYIGQEILAYIAIEEWCAKNGVTWTDTVLSEDQIVAAATSGTGPDIVLGWEVNAFPQLQVMGAGEDLTQYAGLFEDVAGAADAGWFDGKWWGFFLPYAKQAMIQFDQSYFEMRGVKSPKDYFMEGNWTWETFQECCEEIAGDTDGDGVVDVLAFTSERVDYAFARPWKYDTEQNLYVNLTGTEKNRTFYQMMYDLQDICDYPGAYASHGTNANGQYVAMAYNPYYLNGLVMHRDYSSAASEYSVCYVPVPANEEGEEYISVLGNFVFTTAGADTEMAISLMQYMYNLFVDYFEVSAKVASMDALDWFQPVTDFGIALKDRAKQANEIDWATAYAVYDDVEYIQALVDYVLNTPTKYMMCGPTASAFNGTFRPVVLGAPAATSVAELEPVFDDKVKKQNADWLGK